MSKFHGTVHVGMREKDTNKLIAVYPEPIEAKSDEQVRDKVMFWYYQQSCEAEEKMRDYYVDTINEDELKALK